MEGGGGGCILGVEGNGLIGQVAQDLKGSHLLHSVSKNMGEHVIVGVPELQLHVMLPFVLKLGLKFGRFLMWSFSG